MTTLIRKRQDEYHYIDLIRHIMENGYKRLDRTGTGVLSVFGTQSRYNLRNDTFPILTTKKVFWRAICEELSWFISGSTDVNILKEKSIHIWDGKSSKEYMESIGLFYPEECELGPIYGFQWGHLGAEFIDMKKSYTGNKGLDQLNYVINIIKNKPYDKRIIISVWDPIDLPKIALPPCNCLAQFYVANGDISCQLYQKSGDMGLGVPFNIASYSLLTYMIAHVTNLKPGELVHSIGDAHVYTNHIDVLQEQMKREPKPFPKLKIKRHVTSIEDFKFDDFELIMNIIHY